MRYLLLFLLISNLSAREVKLSWDELPSGHTVIAYVHEQGGRREVGQTILNEITIDIPNEKLVVSVESVLYGNHSEESERLVILPDHEIILQYSENLVDWIEVKRDIVPFNSTKGFWRSIIIR